MRYLIFLLLSGCATVEYGSSVFFDGAAKHPYLTVNHIYTINKGFYKGCEFACTDKVTDDYLYSGVMMCKDKWNETEFTSVYVNSFDEVIEVRQ